MVITYYWPPASGPGVQRFLKMTKYFQSMGWEALVLTTEDGTYPAMDESLLQEVGSDVKVYRTKPREVFSFYNRLMGNKSAGSVGFIGMNQKSVKQKLAMYIRANFFIPDARKAWNKSAYKKAVGILENETIDAVISTGPPHSTHLIALALKEKYGLHWLADLRDPWVNVYYNKIFPRTKRTIRKDQRLENLVLQKANAVSVVSPGLKTEFQDRAKKIEIVYNGFDEEDFDIHARSKSTEITISYIGNFKPNQNVPVFWKALKEQDKWDNINIQLTGNIHPEVVQSIKDVGLGNSLKIGPFVSHKEAIQQMCNADFLLFIVPRTSGNNKILTGKIFEYLASKTPIIPIGPKHGDADRILQECGHISMIDYDDLIGMKKGLELAKEGNSNDVYLRYTRKAQTVKLLNLLSES